MLGGGGGNVTFGVYSSSRLIVVSVRHSGPLSKVTSGPRVFLGEVGDRFLTCTELEI